MFLYLIRNISYWKMNVILTLMFVIIHNTEVFFKLFLTRERIKSYIVHFKLLLNYTYTDTYMYIYSTYILYHIS